MERESLGAVPLQRTRLGLIWVQAEIDGQFLRLIVDTGANRTLLDKSAADRLGVDVSSATLEVAGCIADAASEASAGVLRLGTVAVSLEAIAVLDLSPMTQKLGESVDGIIGADLLGATACVIDYGRGELKLNAPQ